MKLQTTLNLVVAGAVAAVLFACGGGGGDTVASGGSNGGGTGTQLSNLTPTTASSNVVQAIDYYGDSTVYGYASGSTGTQVARPAPAVFASLLPSAGRYVVRNEGVSGSTACQLLRGQDQVHPDWATQLANSNPKFVIINHAINDQSTNKGESVSAYSDCLTQLVTIAKQAGKIVIFETPNPTDQSGLGLENYAQAMRTVAAAQGLKVIDQYQYLSAKLGNNDVRTMMPDGTHPNDATYVDKGTFAAQEFLKMAF